MRDRPNRKRAGRTRRRALMATLAGAVWIAAGAAHADEKPPNIVLMLSDNLGFGEIGAYGGGALRGAPTPRLDRLAAESLRFTNFNVEHDPREEVDIAIENLWILEPVMRQVYPFLFSVEKEGLILPGGDEPEAATVEIPFQSQDEIDKSLSAIKWKIMKQRVKEMLPFDGD